MKKIVVMFLVVFFGININSANAELMKNKEGVVKDTPFSIPTSKEEKEAFKTGKEIPLGSVLIKREKTGLLQYRPIKEYEEVVVFNSENNKIEILKKKTVQRGEKRFAYYIPLAFIGMLLLGIANYIATKQGVKNIVIFFTNAGTFIITLISFIISPIPLVFFGGAIILLLIVHAETLLIYRILSLLYCIVIVISLFQ